MAERTLLPTGNEEFDIKIGGGLPFPSLVFIEGPHGTGKTALSQLFLLGALRGGLRSVALVSEATVRGYIEKSQSAGLDLSDYFIRGLLDVFSAQRWGAKWGEERLGRMLPLLESFIKRVSGRYDVFLIDSLSHFAVHTPVSQVLEFFTTLRTVADSGKLVLVTMHEGVMDEGIVTRARAVCDGYLKLTSAVLAGKSVKILKIVKLKGARSSFESTISFDVDPAFGIKLVPIALATV